MGYVYPNDSRITSLTQEVEMEGNYFVTVDASGNPTKILFQDLRTVILARSLPIGSIIMWSISIVIPPGWYLCNGQEVLRSSPLGQFLVATGLPFGVGNGSTTVNVPDFRDKFAVGSGGAYSVGDTGGEDQVTLSLDQIPSHNHYYQKQPPVQTNAVAGSGKNLSDYDAVAIEPQTAYAGSGLPHENKPPFLAMRFIIYGLV